MREPKTDGCEAAAAASEVPSPGTGRTIDALFAALDYRELGPIYCEEGGEAFWEAHRGPAIVCGRAWAAALAPRLSRGGNSLYAGAGVAELPALLTEVLDLERTVRVANLDALECASLNRSLAAVGLSGRIHFEAVDAAQVAALAGRQRSGFDHVSAVSIFDDPVRYPQVSAVTYGSVPPVLLDLEAFAQERERLRGLARALLASLCPPGVITTTGEEVAWFLEAAAACGLRLTAADDAIETAIVGDRLGFLEVLRSELEPEPGPGLDQD